MESDFQKQIIKDVLAFTILCVLWRCSLPAEVSSPKEPSEDATLEVDPASVRPSDDAAPAASLAATSGETVGLEPPCQASPEFPMQKKKEKEMCKVVIVHCHLAASLGGGGNLLHSVVMVPKHSLPQEEIFSFIRF